MNEVRTTPSSRNQPAQGAQSTPSTETRRAVMPPVDVFEDAASITLVADMPGVPKDKLELRLDGDALHIEGSMEPPAPEGLEAVYAEVSVPLFRRTFTLSRELDASKIDASLRDGVLTLRIPKQEHAQPRRIAVTND